MENNIEANNTETEKKHYAAPATPLQWLLRVLQGAIIGAGAILPGISGGVLCVIFGIYQPMMALLAHPLRTFKKYFWLMLPILIGWAVGFLGLARLVELLFQASSNLAIWLFIGLIAGMFPSLVKDAGKKGRSKGAWIAVSISTVVILAVLLFLQYGSKMVIQPNIWWFFACGAIWGLSMVAPGLSSSSLLIFMGLYEPMVAGIANFSFEVIIPVMVGILVVAFASARGINYLFEKHYAVGYHTVLGFVIASTIAIIPLAYNGIVEIVLCVVCCAVGFAAAWLMERAGKKMLARPK